MKVLDRFLRYITIPTNSNSYTGTTPSTESQWQLARILVQELRQLNMDDVYLDEEHCYVYAHLKGNPNAPKIGFIAHMDTSENASDENVKPQIVYDYDGKDIRLSDTETLEVAKFPKLANFKGKTIITSDGTTLLGADDKAGIAEIMTMLQSVQNSNIPHGDIYIAFTPDEEIGEGTKYFDFDKFKADFAYTIDGEDLGELSYENFNACSIKVDIKGLSVHTGSAKNVMVNSLMIANEITNSLPKEYPENTEGYEGFYHLDNMSGDVAHTTMKFLIRDFDLDNFEKRKQIFRDIVSGLNKKYNDCITLTMPYSYANMKPVVDKYPHIIEAAKTAMKNVGVTPIIEPIRGGTDGAELSHKGLPCPNLCAGGHNFHGIHEYVCLEDMEKIVEILVEIVKQFAK
ncbi:MAG: peptidase T [Clostridia bacterium]|nr:peptidase T [Clostridia bacterium]